MKPLLLSLGPFLALGGLRPENPQRAVLEFNKELRDGVTQSSQHSAAIFPLTASFGYWVRLRASCSGFLSNHI
jgi:hypothetical protein